MAVITGSCVQALSEGLGLGKQGHILGQSPQVLLRAFFLLYFSAGALNGIANCQCSAEPTGLLR